MIYTPEQEAKIDTLLTELNTQSEALEASKGTPKEPVIKADLTATIRSLNTALDMTADAAISAAAAVKRVVTAIENNQATNKTNI